MAGPTFDTKEFSDYVGARHQALVRTAYLLTGDHHAAEDLVQASLARVYLARDRIRDKDAIDAYVRRTMINEHTSWWRGWSVGNIKSQTSRALAALRTRLNTAAGSVR